MTRAVDAELTLEVVGQLPVGARGTKRRKVFGATGGTIGRASSNDWVLSDDIVSNRHARITCHNGGFFIEDTNSTNGVFVNDRQLDKGRPHALASGDRLFIEPFDIVATIPLAEVPPTAPAPDLGVRDPFWVEEGAEFRRVQPVGPSSLLEVAAPDIIPESAAGDEEGWLNKLGPAPSPSSDAGKRNVPVLDRDPLKEHHAAPAVRPAVAPKAAARALIPDDYDPIMDQQTPRSRVVPPHRDGLPPADARRRQPGERRTGDGRRARDRRAAATPPSAAPEGVGASAAGASARPVHNAGGDLAAVLAGAGLQDVPVTPELAAQFGQILRVVVAGLLDVLQARQQTKGEFRIANTVIQPTRNNPLKHSVDVDDALHNLLHKRNPAYLGPVAAFEDAFDDLRNHQLAMLSGVRVAFETMFGQFDPERLQKEFDRHTPRAKKGALAAALQSKPDYWDFYREWVRRMSDDADGTFRTLFGEEFARAYEDQLDRLKARAPKGRRPSKGVPE